MTAAQSRHEWSERSATALVARRLGNGQAGPALADFALRLVEHLHAIVRETRPSRDEWRAAIGFLTEVGHAADERRQEWVLLSDLLGVSALVESINSPRPPGATPNTVRGPFYRPGAPKLAGGASISLDGEGEPLAVQLSVVDLDGQPVAGAGVETWQANGEGLYENQEPDRQPEWNLRGAFRADAAGRVAYRTVRPAGYGVPDDGPVGALFRRLGFPLRRPAQLHFIVRAEGFEALTTEIFDRLDPHLEEDALFGVREPLLGRFEPEGDGWRLDHRFVLARLRRDGSLRKGNGT